MYTRFIVSSLYCYVTGKCRFPGDVTLEMTLNDIVIERTLKDLNALFIRRNITQQQILNVFERSVL